MDPTLPTIDFSHGTGPAVIALLTFLVPLVVRTLLKDRAERKEKVQAILQTCARQAYNSVQNRLKRGDAIDDKQAAGLEALDRFFIMRVGRAASAEEKASACLLFDAIHGELCPGGTGTPPGGPTTPAA